MKIKTWDKETYLNMGLIEVGTMLYTPHDHPEYDFFPSLTRNMLDKTHKAEEEEQYYSLISSGWCIPKYLVEVV